MTRRTFINELEEAAEHIGDTSRADLQVMLRRAALRLRNVEGVTLDADANKAISQLAMEMNLPRSEVLRTIVREWLIGCGRIRANTFDEASETDGGALGPSLCGGYFRTSACI